jgi:hypothetical protein
MLRRWNAFDIAVTSFLGLVLSFPFGDVVGIRSAHTWCLPVAAFKVMLVFMIFWASHDIMNMFDFIARPPPRENKTNATKWQDHSASIRSSTAARAAFGPASRQNWRRDADAPAAAFFALRAEWPPLGASALRRFVTGRAVPPPRLSRPRLT